MNKVEVLELISKKKHSNADNLYVYLVKNFIGNTFQVIANNENIYEVDDNVIYVYVGSKLKDGIKVSKRKIRGLDSFGMLLGKSTLGLYTDVTDFYCDNSQDYKNEKIERSKILFQKWPSIERLSNVIKSYYLLKKQGVNLLNLKNCRYGSKVKLHGTNAGILISPDGEVVAQKRSSKIYPDSDNADFAKWVYKYKKEFSTLKSDKLITLFGEWAGPGIQKGVSVSQIPKRCFFIFAIQIGEQQNDCRLIIDPKEINKIFQNSEARYLEQLYILPFEKVYDNINFEDKINLAKFSNIVAEDTLKIEECDPIIRDYFGIEGIGEGLVFYPLVNLNIGIGINSYSQFMFKAKGDKHSVTKVKKVAQIDVEKLESVKDFIDMFLTENRMLQAVNEACNNIYDIKTMGKFLSWLNNDILKESKLELEKSGLSWKKDINKYLMTEARNWYQDKLKK